MPRITGCDTPSAIDAVSLADGAAAQVCGSCYSYALLSHVTANGKAFHVSKIDSSENSDTDRGNDQKSIEPVPAALTERKAEFIRVGWEWRVDRGRPAEMM